MAGTLNNLGLLNRNENRHAEARQQFEEALKIYRSFTANSTDAFVKKIACTDRNLKTLIP